VIAVAINKSNATSKFMAGVMTAPARAARLGGRCHSDADEERSRHGDLGP
jgi:hypothetical protein